MTTSEGEHSAPPTAPADEGLEVVDLPRGLDDEWDETFAWSYGQRFWNVGCG